MRTPPQLQAKSLLQMCMAEYYRHNISGIIPIVIGGRACNSTLPCLFACVSYL